MNKLWYIHKYRLQKKKNPLCLHKLLHPPHNVPTFVVMTAARRQCALTVWTIVLAYIGHVRHTEVRWRHYWKAGGCRIYPIGIPLGGEDFEVQTESGASNVCQCQRETRVQVISYQRGAGRNGPWKLTILLVEDNVLGRLPIRWKNWWNNIKIQNRFCPISPVL
jgi:hypothetical protein